MTLPKEYARFCARFAALSSLFTFYVLSERVFCSTVYAGTIVGTLMCQPFCVASQCDAYEVWEVIPVLLTYLVSRTRVTQRTKSARKIQGCQAFRTG